MVKNLEVITILHFFDGEKEVVLSYNGFLDIRDGQVIDLLKESEHMPILPGRYLVQLNRDRPDQLLLNFTEKPDVYYRHVFLTPSR
jgi:hypothetical protein